MNTTTTTAAARKTSTGTKVYMHTNCSCTRINGKVIADITTVAEAEAYAAEQGFAAGHCKTSEPVAEAAPVGEMELVVENRDQFGKQRRDAVALMVAAVGAEMSFAGIKNKHRTGNDAFAVLVTKAPAKLTEVLAAFIVDVEAGVEEVIEEAKAEGILAGWDSNTRQKHWKNQARQYIATEGAKAAASL